MICAENVTDLDTNNTHTDLGWNVDEPLVEEEADAAVEHVGDVLEDGLVSPRSRLLQQEGPQSGHRLSREQSEKGDKMQKRDYVASECLNTNKRTLLALFTEALLSLR